MIKETATLLFMIAFTFLVRIDIVCGQDLPVLRNVAVNSDVTFDKKTDLYSYTYKLTNPPQNTGQISEIELDILQADKGSPLSSEGLIVQEGFDYEGKILSKSFNEALSDVSGRLQKKLVPVGTQPPAGWSAGISARGSVLWGSEEKKNRIMPGSAEGGYTVISRGLPSIRQMIIHPKWILVVEGYVSEADIEKSKKTEKEIAFYGKTIGPGSPPANFSPLSFIDNIIDLKHQAASFGWIDNNGVVKSLDAKLDNARKKLEQDLPRAAANILTAFINEVEAQGCATYENCSPGKHLTSEAYALLKYNAQYLIDHLK